jgi:serine O-acetyltransferase
MGAVWTTLRADLLRCCGPWQRYQDVSWSTRAVLRSVLVNQGTWAVIEYRLRRWMDERPGPLRLALMPVGHLTRKLMEILTGISLATGARFGPGLYIVHFGEVIVGNDVVVGENCNLSQGVTLGALGESPRIGDCVAFAPGAKCFGPVTVGDHVVVGANAVVNRDVPAWSTAVGVPARAIEGRGNPLGARRAEAA